MTKPMERCKNCRLVEVLRESLRDKDRLIQAARAEALSARAARSVPEREKAAFEIKTFSLN